MTNPKARSTLLRSSALASLLYLNPVGGAAWAQSATYSFDIPAEPLAAALHDFARISGEQIIFTDDLVAGRRTPALHGSYTPDAALSYLLAGTNLVVERSENGGAMIRRTDDTRPTRLGDAGRALPSNVEEIVVTAEKREERLKDVPVPMSVLKAEELATKSQVMLRDYFSTVPGVVLSPGSQSQQTLAIRGISTGAQYPTVAVVVDDIPFGGTGPNTNGQFVPDIDPGDLARIEVLRGPQGTLYGADSLGGLIKFVTIDPSFSGYSGRVEAGASSVYNGDEPGFNFRGSVNAPVSDVVAVRASAFVRQDPGYVDNPVLHLNGVNRDWAAGGRLAVLWRPSDTVSLKLNALYQILDANGVNDMVQGLGDLKQNYIPGTGGYTRTVQLYSAVFKADLGSADLTSITAYDLNRFSAIFDRSVNFGSFIQKIFGVTGDYYTQDFVTKKFSQELRFSGKLWDSLDWLVGGYYTNENIPQLHISMSAENPSTGAIVGQYYNYTNGRSFQEYAAFGDLTYHFTDEFDVQVGLRASWEDIDQQQVTITGPYVAQLLGHPSPAITPAGPDTNATAITYLFTPRYKLSPDLMLYARLASGYQPGGPSGALFPGVPTSYKSNTTDNYEVGAKGDFFDRKLSIDVSLYYIDWHDILITVKDLVTQLNYTTNGGTANSKGLELSLTARPADGLTVSGWISYNDAALSENFPRNSTIYGHAGNRLPESARYTGLISVEQEFPLWGDSIGFVGGSWNYVGDRLGFFRGVSGGVPLPRDFFPSYTRTDFYAGVKRDTWTVTFYVNNAFDERGLLDGGVDYTPINANTYITPRTIGVTVAKTF